MKLFSKKKPPRPPASAPAAPSAGKPAAPLHLGAVPPLTKVHPFGGFDTYPTPQWTRGYRDAGPARTDPVIHTHHTRIVEPDDRFGDGYACPRPRTWDFMMCNPSVLNEEWEERPGGPHPGWYGTDTARQIVGDMPYRLPPKSYRPYVPPSYPLPVTDPQVRPWLGLVLRWYEDPAAAGPQYQMAIVSQVIPGGPAEIAGIKVNDHIEYFENTRLENEDLWIKEARRMKPGKSVDLGIRRVGEPDQRIAVKPISYDKGPGARNPYEPVWPNDPVYPPYD